MPVCTETGEDLAEYQWTISCSPRCNQETGERERGKSTPFKIHQNGGNSVPPHKVEKSTKCKDTCCGGKHVIALAIVTMMMLAPSFGVTFWLIIETIYHFVAHTNPKMYQHPLHRFFFNEFCAYCQAKVRMDKVGKLQDRRYKNYISNVTMGS